MNKQYDIEKISENLNREHKMNSDFDNDDDLGMDFFKHFAEIQKQLQKENDENDELIDKKRVKIRKQN